MIDPASIKKGDKFKIIKNDELFNLDKYQARLTTALKSIEGWKKKSDGNLMSLAEMQQANFEAPIVKDGLSLPPVTASEDREVEEDLAPGEIIEVIQIMYHTNKAASSNTSNKDKAFQCLLVSTVINNETKYGFVWTTHQSEDYIERIPDQKTQPDGNDKPASSGTEVIVKAGQTVVLDVKADAEGTGGKDKGDSGDIETGSFEVELVDEEGKPYIDAEVVQLIGENNIYTVVIDNKTGKGSKDNIVPGEYDVALQIGMVHFEFDKNMPTSSGKDALAKVANKLITTKIFDFKKIRCVGYADKDGSDAYNKSLCLKRAIYVKDQLSKLQERFKKEYVYTAIGGELPGDSDEEKVNNRKVEVYGIVK